MVALETTFWILHGTNIFILSFALFPLILD